MDGSHQLGYWLVGKVYIDWGIMNECYICQAPIRGLICNKCFQVWPKDMRNV